MAEPKRHHFVPRMYLKRFAEDGALHVRWRDGKTYSSRPTNVAVETGFYDVRVDDGSTSKGLEHALAEVESMAATAFRSIDMSLTAPAPGSSDREALALYLALQYTRTPEQRERVLFPIRLNAFLAGRQLTRDLVAEYLTTEHLQFVPREQEVQGAFDYAAVALSEPDTLTPEFAMGMMLRCTERLASAIDVFEWTVEHDRKGRFITSDTPLVIWRPPNWRDRFEGVGINNAQEIRFPLDPGKQLVLSRQRRPPSVRVATNRVAGCNVDMTTACHRFVVARPRHARHVTELGMRPHRPVLRFSSGPLHERQPDGTTVYKGEVMHTWVPRR